MTEHLKIHEIVRGKYLQHEERWTLVTEEDGRKAVIREWATAMPFSKAPDKVGVDRMSVSRALASGGDVARKLREALGAGASG